MPDLPNRRKFENDIARGLGRVMTQARNTMLRQLWRDGFTRADLATLPPDTMASLQATLSQFFADNLRDVYIASANNFAQEMGFGINQDELEDSAIEWANSHSATLASELTTNSQRHAQRLAQTAPDEALTRQNLGQLLGLILLGTNMARITMNAITQVSTATSAGEVATQNALTNAGARVEELWFTQLTENVCPECAPRHGKVRGDGWQMPPPAHPNCRCYIGYRVTNGDTQVILFDDDAVVRRLRRT